MISSLSNAPGALAVRREVERLRQENARLKATTAELRVENADLRKVNTELLRARRALQAMVDAHVERAQRTGSFGPLEMTAGTAVGPRRSRRS